MKTNRMHLEFCTYEKKVNPRTLEMELRLQEYDITGLRKEVVLKLDRWQLEHLSHGIQDLARKMRDEAVACARDCGVEDD